VHDDRVSDNELGNAMCGLKVGAMLLPAGFDLHSSTTADEGGDQVRVNAVNNDRSIAIPRAIEQDTRNLVMRCSAWVKAVDFETTRQTHIRSHGTAKRMAGEINGIVTTAAAHGASKLVSFVTTSRWNTSNRDAGVGSEVAWI